MLEAARKRFASDGFAGTTIRKVAADAQVDASLVMQFYGSKEKLFAAVMEIPPSALERFGTAFEGADDGLGERVARAFLGAWEAESEDSEPLMAMLRGAITHDAAREQLRDFLQSRLLEGARGAGHDVARQAVEPGDGDRGAGREQGGQLIPFVQVPVDPAVHQIGDGQAVFEPRGHDGLLRVGGGAAVAPCRGAVLRGGRGRSPAMAACCRGRAGTTRRSSTMASPAPRPLRRARPP